VRDLLLLRVDITHISPVLPLAVLAGLLFVAACGGGPATELTPSPAPSVRVVTTSVILADFVRNVGGEKVEVRPIVPPGADVHSFQSTPGDSLAISNARVIVSNGLGLDGFLDSLLKSAKRQDSVHVVAADGLDAMAVVALAPGPSPSGREVALSPSKGRGEGRDPHFWQSPLYTVYYVERIRDGLIQADQSNAQVYQDNAAAYIQKLYELDREIAEALSTVPPQRRHLVTFHDAFGHFAERYGWKSSAFVLGDAADVTPGTVVAVMERIKEEGIPAVFTEPQFSADVIGQVARDAGIGVGTIYSDSLDANVPTYIDMMRFNTRSLLENLR